jgi:hypothetical protein
MYLNVIFLEYKKFLYWFLIRWKFFIGTLYPHLNLKFLGCISTYFSSQETARNIWKDVLEKMLRII